MATPHPDRDERSSRRDERITSPREAPNLATKLLQMEENLIREFKANAEAMKLSTHEKAELDQLRAQKDKLESAVRGMQSEASGVASRSKKEVEELTAKLDKANQQIQALKNKLSLVETLRDEFEKCRQELERTKTQLAQQVAQGEDRSRQLVQQLAHAEDRVKQLAQQIAQSEDRSRQLAQHGAQAEERSRQLVQQLAQAEDRVKQLTPPAPRKLQVTYILESEADKWSAERDLTLSMLDRMAAKLGVHLNWTAVSHPAPGTGGGKAHVLFFVCLNPHRSLGFINGWQQSAGHFVVIGQGLMPQFFASFDSKLLSTFSMQNTTRKVQWDDPSTIRAAIQVIIALLPVDASHGGLLSLK